MQQTLIYVAAILVAILAGYWAKPKAGPTWLEQFKSLDDQDQLLLLTVCGLCFATFSSLTVMGVIFITKTFDAVVIGMASGYIAVVNGAAWTTAFAFWFMSSNGSRTAGAALAHIAKMNMDEEPAKPKVAPAAGGDA